MILAAVERILGGNSLSCLSVGLVLLGDRASATDNFTNCCELAIIQRIALLRLLR